MKSFVGGFIWSFIVGSFTVKRFAAGRFAELVEERLGEEESQIGAGEPAGVLCDEVSLLVAERIGHVAQQNLRFTAAPAPTSRMARFSPTVGTSTSTSRSKRPGLRRAGSNPRGLRLI